MSPDSSNQHGDAEKESAKSPVPTDIYPEPTRGFASKHYESESKDNKVTSNSLGSPTGDLPVPVVQVLSVRGVEYTLMTLCLWMCSGALAWSLLAVINGLTSFAILSFPISLMLVTLPIFAFFFLRLKKAEVANPELRFDASKRRLSQFTQVIAFSTCLFNLIAFVYVIMTTISGDGSTPIWKSFLNLLVILAVAGGIFAYYWNDEHRTAKQR